MITDTHTHLYYKGLIDDVDGCIQRARAAGVERMVVVGTDLASSKQCFELASKHAGLFPTAGVHPHDADGSDAETRAEIEALCHRSECVGVGETGLDFFRNNSGREAQLDNFAWHLDLARRLDKPVVIHCRDAHDDTAKIVRDFPGVRGVMHCYTMGPDELTPYLEAGLFISFSGVVTYKKNADNREAAKMVPEERLLVETDCPFLAPEGKRGTRNEPANVSLVLDCVAATRGVSAVELARVTSANATALFGLPDLDVAS